jgi:uncharacterized protein YndB with AHSA1/START domain
VAGGYGVVLRVCRSRRITQEKEEKKKMIPPVVKTVTVDCSPENAFLYFTRDFGKWWPGASHSVVAFASEHKESPAFCGLHPRLHGKIFERESGGKEHHWGTIILWEPPARVAFTWHPGRPEDAAQTVEVTFSAVSAGTLVTLTHTGWEKLGADAEAAWKSYNSGWETVFSVCYAGYVNQLSGNK